MSSYSVPSIALSGHGFRVGIVASRFNGHIVDSLLESCQQKLWSAGIDKNDIVLKRVPGALEIPLALLTLSQHYSPPLDVLIALGCIIKGDTYHFEVVCDVSAQGVLDVQLQTGIPIANAILTVYQEEQAWLRVDKGAEAAQSALEMAELVQTMSKNKPSFNPVS